MVALKRAVHVFGVRPLLKRAIIPTRGRDGRSPALFVLPTMSSTLPKNTLHPTMFIVSFELPVLWYQCENLERSNLAPR